MWRANRHIEEMKKEHHVTNGCNVKIIVSLEAYVDHDKRFAAVSHDSQRPDFMSRDNSTMTGSIS